MFYRMMIICEESDYYPAAEHLPIIVQTMTMKKADITEKEINAVAEAFKAQILGTLKVMAGI